MRSQFLTILALTVALSATALATPTMDFEAVGPTNTDVGSFYSYLPGSPSFFGATILRIPDYNYNGYPPASGINVAYSCCSGEIGLAWTSGISGLSFYIDSPYYGASFVAYDKDGATVSSGAIPNTTFGLPGAVVNIPGTGIRQLTILGTGNYYVMDDVHYNVAATPEPATLAMLGSGLLALGGALRRKFLP